MPIDPKEIRIETMRGRGPGGQHKNKTDSAVRVTHLPTGIQVTIDGRKQGQNKKQALAELERRLAEQKAEKKAAKRKARRDEAIKESETARTYDFQSGQVRDHRTKKRASIKDVLEKGKIELLR